MKLLIGSSNKGKIIEINEALNGLNVQLFTPLEISVTDVPTETGETYIDNARQKAQFYFGKSKLPTLADDSGIIVEALTNELGVHTRRWGAGPEATDHAWITFFLDRMRREENKRARFICTLCHIDEQGNEHTFEGSCDGIITNELEADFLPGLPISACFKPDGYDRVYSALTIEEKNAISHRGKALHQFRDYVIRVKSNA